MHSTSDLDLDQDLVVVVVNYYDFRVRLSGHPFPDSILFHGLLDLDLDLDQDLSVFCFCT